MFNIKFTIGATTTAGRPRKLNKSVIIREGLRFLRTFLRKIILLFFVSTSLFIVSLLNINAIGIVIAPYLSMCVIISNPSKNVTKSTEVSFFFFSILLIWLIAAEAITIEPSLKTTPEISMVKISLCLSSNLMSCLARRLSIVLIAMFVFKAALNNFIPPLLLILSNFLFRILRRIVH